MSFDLLFHGRSEWPETEIPISLTDWKALVTDILDKEQIGRFSVIGYSYGGKICIATANLMPERVDALYLAAADGIHFNFWFRLATGTALMRRLFLILCKNPGPFLWLVKTLSKLRLISRNLGRFVAAQLAAKANRKRLYLSWVGFRGFTLRQRQILQMLNANDIRLEMVAGKYDSVIPWKDLQTFTSKVHNGRFHLIHTGHQSLLKKFNESLNR